MILRFVPRDRLRHFGATHELAVGLSLVIVCSCFPRAGSPEYFDVTTADDAPDSDPGDGVCASTLPGGACTLRAAIEESNARPSSNTIRLGAATYRLTLLPVLRVTENVQISGTDANRTEIDGTNRGRGVFHFDGSVAVISDLIIKDGGGDGVAYGGAVYIDNGSSITMTNVSVRDSYAFTGGGGIAVAAGTLILFASDVWNNNARGAFGGGIFVGGAGMLTMDRSTVRDNASNRTGAIHNQGTIRIYNSTISGNRARSPSRGTGALANDGTATLNNVTIFNNEANSAGDSQSTGGFSATTGSTSQISNTIIAGNRLGTSNHDCIGAIGSEGYNLVQVADHCTLTGTLDGNVIGRDPELLPLSYVGVATLAHLPRTTSPVISAGHPQTGSGVTARGRCESRDQAGEVRRLTGSARCDIGSIERHNE